MNFVFKRANFENGCSVVPPFEVGYHDFIDSLAISLLSNIRLSRKPQPLSPSNKKRRQHPAVSGNHHIMLFNQLSLHWSCCFSDITLKLYAAEISEICCLGQSMFLSKQNADVMKHQLISKSCGINIVCCTYINKLKIWFVCIAKPLCKRKKVPHHVSQQRGRLIDSERNCVLPATKECLFINTFNGLDLISRLSISCVVWTCKYYQLLLPYNPQTKRRITNITCPVMDSRAIFWDKSDT